MARNIEIKARAPELAAVRARAERLSSGPPEVLAQKDVFFVVPRGRLKVREFADGSGELISYSRPDAPGPRESSYALCPCRDAQALARTLSAVLAVRGTVVKRREVFLAGRTRIHLDQVEGLGDFVELEVVLADGEWGEDGVREARRLLDALGIPDADLVSKAYVDLLEETRQA